MKSFAFHRDPLFGIGCAAYALNRWVFKPLFATPFLHSHFNDLWLIPCALPLILWIHRRLGWRGSAPPTFAEVTGHLLLWSFLFEIIGPHLLPHVTGDYWDMACYWSGGLVAWVWWNRFRLWPRLLPA